ncbi:aspartate--tRNA(Asn) ligase [Carboxydochorda subterranea]|uniref:Aspartate--tRNA(Asp/Asn) ligase n=1 Tax=Carboxydichorda subterranea TaxID=3109565 RepID=A0ABZ1BTY9_9FIRM|nr:aspartate--tRNA(Asn) ligase [Limnochorda sp. L945t]WRP16053.1 aspartate--tRNA(Asn) ligase [Limnochorda sp. L945t]
MQDRVCTSQLGAHVGERVTVAGWLHARRRLGGLTFILIRDGWGLCQLTVEGRDPLEGVENESVVAATGTVVAAPEAPGGIELRDGTTTVISPAEAPPLTLSKRELRASLPTQLDLAAISLRHPARRRVFQVAAAMVAAFRETLRGRAFTEIFTPKVLGGASEGGANVFALDYFGRRAFLAQSPQLYKQIMVGVFERVFEVGPVFRAEPHETTRHLNQYTSLDAEMGFITDHRDVMAVVEEVVAAMVAAAGAQEQGVRRPFPTVAFWEAQEIIHSAFGRDVRGEEDLSPQDERDLGQWAKAEFGSDFLFVTGYPLAKRPFYTQPDPNHPGDSNSFDLLFRGLEIVTGGQRLHRYADYLAALEARGMAAAPLEWYLLAFRHGMPPHGGFAIGLERFAAQLLGLANVREAALFPRDMSRLQP